jgi:L-threonylcarbamoyladenylate synthase
VTSASYDASGRNGKGRARKRTLIMKVDAREPEIVKIRIAARVIRRGGTVAFPTETVYGLGADAFNAEAVNEVFVAKKRPPDNPMIVHIATKGEVHKLAKEVPKLAEKLMDLFWPGPLTLVLRRAKAVPDITVAGLDTVAIRMPDNPVALALISESGTSIAAPSANLAGRPSPTAAAHVLEDLAGRIDVVLDAGATRVGVESTVIDMTTDPPQILRPGGITYEELERALGKVTMHPMVMATRRRRLMRARSPGMKHKHYAPNAEVIVVEGKPRAVMKKVQELADLHRGRGKCVGIMATDESQCEYLADVVKSLGSRENPATAARRLYGLLREFDDEGVDVIIAEGTTTKGLGLAVANRLRRASGFNIVKV